MMKKTPTPLLKIQNLHKNYNKKKVLKGINCKIESERVVGIIGPNGAGKTTLLKILATLLKQNNGKFWINGISPSKDLRKVRNYIGYCPDRLPIEGKVTGYDFLRFFAKIYGKDKLKVEGILEQLKMKEDAFRPIKKYSKGMVKRIALARTFLLEPDLYLLDEPTSGLDPSGQRKIQNAILSMEKRGKLVILSSHNLYEVERICDEIYFLTNGKLTTIDSVSDAFGDEGPVIIDITLKNIDDSLIDALVKEFDGLKLITTKGPKVRFSSKRTLEKEKLVEFIQEKGEDIVGIKYL